MAGLDLAFFLLHQAAPSSDQVEGEDSLNNTFMEPLRTSSQCHGGPPAKPRHAGLIRRAGEIIAGMLLFVKGRIGHGSTHPIPAGDAQVIMPENPTPHRIDNQE